MRTYFSLSVTCLPCRRNNPKLKNAEMEKMSIEVVKDEKPIKGPETYVLPDFADNMFAL